MIDIQITDHFFWTSGLNGVDDLVGTGIDHVDLIAIIFSHEQPVLSQIQNHLVRVAIDLNPSQKRKLTAIDAHDINLPISNGRDVREIAPFDYDPERVLSSGVFRRTLFAEVFSR